MALHSRIKRINEELRSIVAEVIQNEVKDPRLTDVLVTITNVFTSKDLHQAQVFVSVLGNDEQTKAAMAALEHSRGYIKREVASRVTFRFMPDLLFKLDETGRNADRINTLLRKIERDNPEAFEEPADEETEPGTEAPEDKK